VAKRKKHKPLMALVMLAAAALVAASVTFTNVTYWLINATKPPAMKYAGADTSVAGGKYVKVSYYYDRDRGINITHISLIGFTGDPTNYTSVIKVCNYYGGATTIKATLVWAGRVKTTGYENYIKAFLVGPAVSTSTGANINGVGFVGSENSAVTVAGPYTINPSQCLDIGAYVVVDPSIAKDYPNVLDGDTTLGQYQINIVMSPQ
jgi:hypothetical protein